MTRIVLFVLLLVFLVGVPWGIISSLRNQRRRREEEEGAGGSPRPGSVPVKPPWAKLARRSPRFAEALAVRERIVTLVQAQQDSDAPRYGDLLSEVDRLTERMASNLNVMHQLETHLAAFDPVRIGRRKEALGQRLAQARDADAKRLLEASLAQLDEQMQTRDSIQARGERLLSTIDHSVIQLEAVHLDLINVLSAGVQSDSGQVAHIKERIRDLAEEMGMDADQNDELAHLVIEDQIGRDQALAQLDGQASVAEEAEVGVGAPR